MTPFVVRASGLLGVFLILAGAWISSDSEAATGSLADPRSGQIDGRVAVMIVPGRNSGDGFKPLLLVGFEVHLTPLEQPGTELVYPAGIWFQSPRDAYCHGGGQTRP